MDIKRRKLVLLVLLLHELHALPILSNLLLLQDSWSLEIRAVVGRPCVVKRPSEIQNLMVTHVS